MSDPSDKSFLIRSFRASDLPACQKLYVEGLVGGRLAENDTGFDIDDIESAYMSKPANHFWVGTAPAVDAPSGSDPSTGEVVGMVGVQAHDAGVGEIRRLRVAQAHRRRGIGSALVETALHFCHERQYLKITLDTFMERDPAVQLFRKFRFRHDRTRRVADRDLMYFYLDLYMEEQHRSGHGG